MVSTTRATTVKCHVFDFPVTIKKIKRFLTKRLLISKRLTGVAPTYDHTLSYTYHYCDRNINIFSSQDSSHTFHLFFLPEFPGVWRLVTATFLVTWSSPCVLFGYLLTKSKVQNIN
ncbi:hypothetical protein RRG08_004337 [Elysia crispata]|uniref:Uncharacterized protein n=1 Tax=Elysia crispata TaxID=231223 RepID=A0AAE1E7U5_9GAST|nr:hypothetical protein RRG08_004337 [Elysia crispata]